MKMAHFSRVTVLLTVCWSVVLSLLHAAALTAVPRGVVTPVKVLSLLLHSCDAAAVMDRHANI